MKGGQLPGCREKGEEMLCMQACRFLHGIFSFMISMFSWLCRHFHKVPYVQPSIIFSFGNIQNQLFLDLTFSHI